MPKHVLMSQIEIITDGGRRCCWTAAEKLRIAEETLDGQASISVVARRNGGKTNYVEGRAGGNQQILGNFPKIYVHQFRDRDVSN